MEEGNPKSRKEDGDSKRSHGDQDCERTTGERGKDRSDGRHKDNREKRDRDREESTDSDDKHDRDREKRRYVKEKDRARVHDVDRENRDRDHEREKGKRGQEQEKHRDVDSENSDGELRERNRKWHKKEDSYKRQEKGKSSIKSNRKVDGINGSPSSKMEGSRVLQGKSMDVFKDGVIVVITFWWEIRCFVERERKRGGCGLKLHQICHRLFSWFIQSKDPPCVSSTKITLQELISFFVGHLSPIDNSIEEVSEQLVAMYEECLQGDFSSVEVIKEANISRARRQMGKQMKKFKMETPSVEKIKDDNLSRALHLVQEQANSSERDCSKVQQVEFMGVFREGIGLLIHDLWEDHTFVQELCGSDPQLMLQELADEILFWFTQTIRPLSFDLIEWIVRNEMYCLPVDVNAANKGFTKEVATKLMTMYEECSQGNFRSVEILKEIWCSEAR